MNVQKLFQFAAYADKHRRRAISYIARQFRLDCAMKCARQFFLNIHLAPLRSWILREKTRPAAGICRIHAKNR